MLFNFLSPYTRNTGKRQISLFFLLYAEIIVYLIQDAKESDVTVTATILSS